MTKRALYLLLPVIFLTLFYFYPLFAIMRLSFAPTGTLDLTALSELVSSSYYLKTLWFTLWQAILSTILTVVVALPGAYVFATYRFRGKTLLQALTTIPFVLPTIVVANAFTALIGPRQNVAPSPHHHPLCFAHHRGRQRLYCPHWPARAAQQRGHEPV